MRSKRIQHAQRSARMAIVCLVLAIIGGNVALSAGMGSLFHQLRDPEYGRKRNRLEQRLAERPDRPLLIALGSSRVAMGLRPDVIENDESTRATFPTDSARPVVFNYALIGSGPVMELMCLRRLLADGIRPDGLIIELWAPFLYQEGPYREEVRIDVNRVRRDDLPLLKQYVSDFSKLESDAWFARIVPWYTHRFYLVSQMMPGWLPWKLRRDFTFLGLDGWGWMPANREPVDAAARAVRFAKGAEYYAPFLAHWTPSPNADRAVHELLDFCRAQNIPVQLLIMPESQAFRGLYGPEALARAEAYYQQIAKSYQLPLIDARQWGISDDELLDGFHLSAEGARQFSEMFGRNVLSTFHRAEARP